jgi:hemerythrin-like domain-containing protein
MAGGSAFPGFASPAAGMEAPLEMLSACHGRVESQCRTLQRLAVHVAVHGADVQAQTAAANVMRYFDTAGRHHHQDEEVDLFPALLEAMAGSDAVCIRDLTRALSADHRALEALWHPLRAVLAQVATGISATLDIGKVKAFSEAYAEHIKREEEDLLPMAGRLLGDMELSRVGKAMRERRGITQV